ncbi:CD225/dispanin family protein [Amycolatopsis samaneae]|uniref:CD225/dispanin family protein n=1 Tax=Amycolatopsis samaneae TaxID=664691 RepID=A0ABW5GDF8_9PSEU
MTYQYPPPYPPGGQQPYGGYPNYGPPPDNNLVWAILATVLCCLPLGIVAIVKSSQVNSLWFQGMHVEARKAADDAKKWAMWSAISIGIILLLYVIFIVVMLVIVGTSVKGFTP